MTILYEDKFLLVVKKERGITTQENKNGEKCLLDLIRAHYGDDNMPLSLINRLDKEVSGIVLIAKTQKCAASLNQLQQERKIKKKYLAVVKDVPLTKKGRFDDLLFKDSKKNKTFVVERMRKGVKDASLLYEVLSNTENNGRDVSLCEIELITGRTHQIRVQFSSRKMPILGDTKYGSSDRDCQMALSCISIEFIHPITKKEISVLCPIEKTYPWSLFDTVLNERGYI